MYSTTEQLADNPEFVPEWGERRKLPGKLSLLRQKLYCKAKHEPKFRFYALYDRIYRKDVLWAAWELVRRNKGAAGVDSITIDQIVAAEDGPQKLVESLHEELRSKTYKPQHVKHVYIPKPDGRERPLGIPTIRDRVVQTATLLILEPIFEADFLDCSYGFRPKRSAHQALDKIKGYLKAGFKEVYDADLKSYFDTIPHDQLLKALKMRIADGSVLTLIRMWLETPIADVRENGPPKRNSVGTPQGGVISPLLANVYLHWFDYLFHRYDGPAKWANAKLVRYADDFVILARKQGDRLQKWVEHVLETRLKLRQNREKTKVVRLTDKGVCLDFLGFSFRYDKDLRGGAYKYLNAFPSKKALARERGRLREMTDKRQCYKPIDILINQLNRHLKGWANYFKWGYPRMALREVNRFVRDRLVRHLCRRSQRRYRPPSDVTWYEHFKRLNVAYL